MSITLFRSEGGELVLPNRDLNLVPREDGGNLIVNPARAVWDRSELTPSELIQWSFLTAAAARAMLDTLPQLAGGCVNYWDAGNWALNEQAQPHGPKSGPEHRRVHLHLLGRSRTAKDPSWRWGEAPTFPDFTDRFAWAAKYDRLTPEECERIVVKCRSSLASKYGTTADGTTRCESCRYPFAEGLHALCDECRNSRPR